MQVTSYDIVKKVWNRMGTMAKTTSLFMMVMLVSSNMRLVGQAMAEPSAAAKCIVENGLHRKGSPYVASTLETEGDERLVCHSDKFDCVTFVEYIVALSLYQGLSTADGQSLVHILQKIRYLDGHIDGYGSRIHYFTQWIMQQERYGLVRDMTLELGGIPYDKPIHFMSKHKTKYPKLMDKKAYQKVLDAEKTVTSYKKYFLPKSRVEEASHMIQPGDIIAITTTVEGLDIVHTGFAVKVDGVVHLLHASETEKKVVVSKQSLAAYLLSHPKQSGIIVLRCK